MKNKKPKSRDAKPPQSAPAHATPRPAAEGIEVKPGVLEKPVTPDVLTQFGLEPYGATDFACMRLYESARENTLEFWFPDDDPEMGAITGFTRRFATAPGKNYRLLIEIYDGYEEDKYPNRIVQKTVLDGAIVDTHDISAPAFMGWRTVEHTFAASKAQSEVNIFLEVVGPLEPWHWGYACRAIIRSVQLIPID